MTISPTPLKDCFLFEMPVFGDERGYFMESFNHQKLHKHLGNPYVIKQVNIAKSSKNVLRGLHFQIPPHAQSKIVGVHTGSVLDVIVDMRKTSPTHGQYHRQILDRPGRMMMVPKGFAHGYLTLEDNTQFFYYVDEFYAPNHEAGLRFNDEDLNIDWGFQEKPLVSAKDLNQPLFKDLPNYFE